MKLERTEQLTVFYEPEPESRVKVGRLALRQRQILFEYDAAFVASKLQISPFNLPLTPDVKIGKPELLDGLMGVFEDSLPDGWGKLLIDRKAAELGMSGAALTPLDRLALVGSRSMGALIYQPEVSVEDPEIVRLAELAQEAESVLFDKEGADLERLIAVGGSPKGARPKVLIQLGPKGQILSGARTIREGFTAWLVKFPARGDDPHSASLEHAYFLMARSAGIETPCTQVLSRTNRNPGYFAIERFDRIGTKRIHVHTLGGLLQIPHGYTSLDYADLLAVTRRLTRNEGAVVEMFRRACFNVFAHNRDDHSRNFAFMMDEKGIWKPSPAYDLTFSDGPGGEHTMLIAKEGRNPGVDHLKALAELCDVKNGSKIIDEVDEAVGRFKVFAEKAEVPAKLSNKTAKALALPSPRSRRGSASKRK